MGVLLTILATAIGAEMHFAGDRMPVVNGERTFVIGLYELPQADADLKRAADAGINLMYGHSVSDLDRLQAHGVHGWINTGYDLDLSADTDGRRANLDAKVAEYAAHPAMLVWEVPDEALWNVWHIPHLWRHGEEPELQREAIANVADKARRAKLQAMFDTIQALDAEGRYAEAEAKADALSRLLGIKAARPDQYFSTAPERMVTMAQGMRDGYARLRAIDPDHPVWMNHAPRNSIEQLALFGEAAGAVGCDIYPIPEYRTGHSDLADRSRTCVGEYTRRMQASAPGKPVFMVLQGFGWADIADYPTKEDFKVQRRPTFAETRYMAYDAIVNGARGILYWGTAYIEKDSPCWFDVLKLTRELADRQPILAAPEPALDLSITYEETWGSVQRGVRVLPKLAPDGLHVIVVNEWHEPRVCTIAGVPDGTYVDIDTDESLIGDGGLTLPMRGHGIRVLRNSGTGH